MELYRNYQSLSRNMTSHLNKRWSQRNLKWPTFNMMVEDRTKQVFYTNTTLCKDIENISYLIMMNL